MPAGSPMVMANIGSGEIIRLNYFNYYNYFKFFNEKDYFLSA